MERLNADSLNITEEQFETYMNGDTIPDGTSSIYICDGLKIVHENKSMLTKLQLRQSQCIDSITQLQDRVAKFKAE